MNDAITFAVLTVSDRCRAGETTDTSGPAIAQYVRENWSGRIVATDCVADEGPDIAARLRGWSHDPRPDVILTTGGTGLAPRDGTPEATRGVLEREHPGLIALMQLRCYARTPLAFLSRGAAGTIGRTLVINLPGSRKAAIECLEALADVLPHAVATLRGQVAEHAPGSR